jgi:sulfide:quinone oxidoreductase
MRNFALKYYATHTKFCIVGGGTAGLNISAHLAKHYDPKSIRIFEPSKLHYYQPGFTMIGGNLV